MKDEQLWKAALGQLELQVSKGNFLTWFRFTKVKERNGDTIIIETGSPFAYEWLSRKYYDIILQTLQSLDKKIEKVEFSINSQSNQKRAVRKNFHITAQKQPRVVEPVIESQPVVTPTPGISITTKQFNPKYTFESYITGPSNEVAHAACRGVAGKPGEAYNPLFIYGGVGLGKTHLLQAIGNSLIAQNPNIKVLYVSAEKFINEFIQALQHRTLQERLASRLSGGMILDVKKPDYETRLAILEAKAASRSIEFDPQALAFIAKNIQKNVRELEGALNRVIAYCELHNTRATLEYTTKVLEGIMDQAQHKTINIKQIIDAVSTYYNLPADDLCGKCRKKEIVRPRQIAMYLLRKESNMSFPSIGEYFGGRDHTTAMHACEKIERLLDQDQELNQEINFLKERLYA